MHAEPYVAGKNTSLSNTHPAGAVWRPQNEKDIRALGSYSRQQTAWDRLMKYNGWKNWETWNVALWLDNEYSSYKHWQEFIESEQPSVSELARELMNEHDLNKPTPDFDANDDVRVIDWDEIAENLLEATE